MRGPNRNVFVNCPFDADFRPCFEALLFTIAASGYKARCALEDADGANIRFDKLRKLIRESRRTIHDLSRIELGTNALPRFNMPFELGLAIGAKYFGGPSCGGIVLSSWCAKTMSSTPTCQISGETTPWRTTTTRMKSFAP